jgi:asparagine synthase (glutamine-hydrolysing)
MSGIVGILNADGAPIDRGLLRQMTQSLAFRGPDAQEMWIEGPAGFGHTLFRTTFESETERQPASLDGEAWIVADARIDARADLIRKLRNKGEGCSLADPDCQLILYAYRAWGEACVEHLLGDFAFAIWDTRERWLFCARDHFGVKPFFYAHVGDHFVFSNTLNCVRIHPAVSDELNDQAIADFLLFEGNQEPDTTSFADINRLPAAHVLSLKEGSICIRRYWTLPVDGALKYRRASEYLEQFLELSDTAVADRLRTNRVGIFLSGGLDSSTVAASAHSVIERQGQPTNLHAYSIVYDWLIPDSERFYSGLVAEKLAIPIHYFVADGYTLFDRADQPETRTPEPSSSTFPALSLEVYRCIASQERVVLTGEGGDPGFATSLSKHLSRLFRSRKYGQLIRDLCHYFLAEGRISRLYLRRRLSLLLERNPWKEPYPTWLNQSLEAELNLRRRWETSNQRSMPAPANAPRPEALRMLAEDWTSVFEAYDAAITGCRLEARHPFFDIRLMRFLAALPALPWAVDKLLLREAGRGRLPDRARLRPKTPLVAEPVVQLLHRPDSWWIDQFTPAPLLHRYVDRARIPTLRDMTDKRYLWVNLRPLCLNLWLQTCMPLSYKGGQEENSEANGSSVRQEGV